MERGPGVQSYQEFFHNYRMMYRPYVNKMNSVLMKYQLYTSQWGILRLLAVKGPHNFVDIANAIYVEKPSVTRLISKLIELGFVETKPGTDKREKYAHLTVKGEEMFHVISEDIHQTWLNTTDGISEEELKIASEVLEKVRRNLLE